MTKKTKPPIPPYVRMVPYREVREDTPFFDLFMCAIAFALLFFAVIVAFSMSR